MRTVIGSILAGLTLMAAHSSEAARKVPYWASLNAGEVMMRTGPGRNFPADWLYRRRGLPVKVVALYTVQHSEWRKIEDPDGTVGWVQANLLSDQRSGLVVGDIRPLRERPAAEANVVWRAEPGVVGHISQCANGWCKFDVHGRVGFVATSQIVGVNPDETVP